MDLRSLQLFRHLATTLHFGKTATMQHVSPSTLSRAVQRIEEQLGSQLFIRDNRSVMLTKEGHKFLLYAEQQLEQFDLLRQSLSESKKQLSGSLSIYCSVTASYTYLPPLLENFRQAHPNIDINLDTGDAADGIEQLKNQRIDLAIAAHPDDLPSSLYFQTIASVPLGIIIPTINCAVKKALQTTTVDWSKIPIILPEHGVARKRFEQWFRLHHLGKPQVYAQVAGQEALVSMVALGFGIGLSPIVVVDNSPVKDRITLLAKTSIEPFNLGLCCFKKRREDPIVAAFLGMAPALVV
ncbi:MAG: HTH-type transcriptional activator IlvY [Porticoccaceae bacterium]|nr:HTH-type transcriptional activator IlvY [Porticoccaceae bacterium]MDG1475263.1 HTH-type transcriptional activator IlvY [Porticoccaceae bacterium]